MREAISIYNLMAAAGTFDFSTAIWKSFFTSYTQIDPPQRQSVNTKYLCHLKKILQKILKLKIRIRLG